MDTRINIAHVEESSQIYGPGKRFVIWVQGCTLACKGCWNTAMWSLEARTLIERQGLLDQIIAAEGIDGVTLLGGEPLQQVENVTWLTQKLQVHNLSVMLYSGYDMDEIIDHRDRSEILEYIDILISGRYEQAQRNTDLLWRGSENQQVHFLTERYKGYEIEECNQVEINIDDHGGVTALGFPSVELLI